jgi:Fe-S cluster assembly protein SufD
MAPYCKSDLLYKTALQDRSRTVWRGMIKVDKPAQRTDAYQRNDNLMLSRDARADSIPGLEIEADDVRCTHGSTSGRVDEHQLFYAMTVYARGCADDCLWVLSTSFRSDAIESVRDTLGEAIGRQVRHQRSSQAWKQRCWATPNGLLRTGAIVYGLGLLGRRSRGLGAA